jgi:membrane protease YdiL (CAAX protease family)
MNWIFQGNQGLRAGWSALIFLAIFLALAVGGVALAEKFVPMDERHPVPPVPAIVREGIQLLAVFAATWVMSRIERRPVLSYGFLDRRRIVRLLSGLAVGVAAMSILVASLSRSGFLVFDGRVLYGLAAWKYAGLWGAAFLTGAFFEEGLLRGYLQFTLTRGLNFWLAAVILSVLFGAMHGSNSGESPIGLVSAGGAGLMFCLSLWLTRSLWWAVGVHAGWNWASACLYGVPDSGLVTVGHLYAMHPVGKPIWSGGATGPEGSAYGLVVEAAITLGIWTMWRRNLPLDSEGI